MRYIIHRHGLQTVVLMLFIFVYQTITIFLPNFSKRSNIYVPTTPTQTWMACQCCPQHGFVFVRLLRRGMRHTYLRACNSATTNRPALDCQPRNIRSRHAGSASDVWRLNILVNCRTCYTRTMIIGIIAVTSRCWCVSRLDLGQPTQTLRTTVTRSWRRIFLT